MPWYTNGPDGESAVPTAKHLLAEPSGQPVPTGLPEQLWALSQSTYLPVAADLSTWERK